MSEEATEELETTETASTETEAPTLEAETTSEETEIEASTEDEKTETEEDVKRRNQEFALRRKTAKQAKELRESKAKIAELEQKANSTKAPVADDYENYDDFIQATVDYRVKQQKPESTYDPVKDYADELTAQGRAKYDDFEQKAWASREMLPVLEEFEHAEDIAYYLGQNPQDAERIQRMSSVGMAREFAKIELKVNQPKPRTTQAPKPVKPIETAAKTSETDPDKMSMAEYAAWRNKQQYG